MAHMVVYISHVEHRRVSVQSSEPSIGSGGDQPASQPAPGSRPCSHASHILTVLTYLGADLHGLAMSTQTDLLLHALCGGHN